ncbi:type II toxin-antitoxin system HipA family toxin, partial [Bacteroidota bacterium]
MHSEKTDILVFAHWAGIPIPKPIGTLSVHQGKGRKTFSFEYDSEWINSREQHLLDSDIGWFTGPQFPPGKENFGVFFDSMPDIWGKTLMRRRAALNAKQEGKPVPKLYEIDYLLGVFDKCRMGALRFKLEPEGPFLDDNQDFPAPPWASIRDLQYGVEIIESEEENIELEKWLSILLAPGSSLGGARPKSNILDSDNSLWIAKFPSRNDAVDKGLWEYLAHLLTIRSGI